MKILAIILMLGGIGGILNSDILAGLLFLVSGIFLFKKKRVEKIKEITQKKTQDKSNRKTAINFPKKDIDYSIIITKIKDYESNGSEFIVLDFETTGLSPEYDRIIEIGALKFSNNELVESFSTLINPKRSIPIESTKIHGITDLMVADKPTIYDVIPTLLTFIGNLTIVAHNASFDIGFLKNSCKRCFKDEYFNLDNRIVDTVKLSRKMFPDLNNHKLATVANHIGVKIEHQHRSTDDALATAQIYITYLKSLEAKLIERQKEFTEEELNLYEMIKNMLLKNNRPTDYIKYRRTGKYFDIDVFYNFLRVKLNGKKYYVLSELSIEELSFLNDEFELEEGPKSENKKTRILIKNVIDIIKLDSLVLDSFDKALESMEYYRDNVKSAKRNIEEYANPY